MGLSEILSSMPWHAPLPKIDPTEMRTNLTNVVVAYVPVRAVPDVKPCPVFLDNHARHHVLEGLAQLVEFLHASIAYCVNPM